jgi:hypothetical protein
MSKKPKSAPSPKAAICKEPNCFETPALKGFCRLHFLKVLAGKSEGDAVAKGQLSVAKDRRRADRLKGLVPEQGDEIEGSEALETLGELNVDLDDLEDLHFDGQAGAKQRKKAG